MHLAQPAHRLGAGHQPGPQAAGDRREDGVVDGAAVVLADPAVVGEVRGHRDHPALLGEPAGQRGLPLGPATGQGVGHPADPRGDRLGVAQDRVEGAAHRVGGRVRLRDGLLERRREQSRGRRPAACRPLVGPVLLGGDLGLVVAVEQDLPQVDGLDAVDERLVRLVEQRHLAVGQPLDEVDLPERAAPVERTGDDPAHELAELVGRARAGQRGAAYVVAEVEGLVVDPDRVGDPPRHLLETLAVARHERDPVGDERDQPVVVEARVLGVEDLHGRVVTRRRRRLVDQEGEVALAQALRHRCHLRPRAGPWSDVRF